MSCITKSDFEYNEKGEMVLTREFLLRRGHCCGSGCTNCPYDELSEVDPNVPAELKDRWQASEEAPEVYEFDIPEDQEI